MNIFQNSYRMFARKLHLCFLVFILFSLQGCKEDSILVGETHPSGYKINENTLGYLINSEGKTERSLVEVDGRSSIGLALQLSKVANESVQGELQYDAGLVEAYNKKNGTNLTPLPQNLIQFENQGKINIEKGKDKSNFSSLQINVDQSIAKDKVYLIPIRTKITGGQVTSSAEMGNFFVQVKNVSGKPNANKKSGMKIISIIEINDTNPLVHTSFSLKGENKPLFDVVVLFSANINYDENTKRVYVLLNENIQHILDNREKYIKPLQDQGTKVVLSILGNHDRAGVANLSPANAKAFAQELKALCTAYQLDGIMLDDEYSNYQYPPPPGFISPSNQAAARLYYEIKQAMPDKINIVYTYGRTADFSGQHAISEAAAGDYIDYVVNDYSQDVGLSRFPGVPRSHYGTYSEEFARDYMVWDNYDLVTKNGDGTHMIFALDQTRSNFDMQLEQLQIMTKAFFNDELSYNKVVHRKDW